MKFHVTLSVLLVACFSAIAFGQQAKLEGTVSDEHGKAVSGVRVFVDGGQAATTDARGHFSIAFHTSITAGHPTRIHAANWKVFDPIFGECWTQSVASSREPLKVTIVSPSSTAAHLSRERLGAIVARYQKGLSAQSNTIEVLSRKVDELSSERAKYAFLKEYGDEYGVPLSTLKDSLDQWAEIKDAKDKLESVRQRAWKGDWDAVVALTDEPGAFDVELFKQRNRQRNQEEIEDGRREIAFYTNRGDALAKQNRFREALACYGLIVNLFDSRALSREDLLEEWGDTKIIIGNQKTTLAEKIGGAEGRQLLVEALADYRDAATLYPREQSPADWALVQYGTAITLMRLGEQSSAKESLKYLNEALAVITAVLEIRTRSHSESAWARTQTALGALLVDLGQRTEGAEGFKYLQNAVNAYKAALETRTREEVPEEWAATQNDLCAGLVSLGRHTTAAESLKYLNEAVTACRAAQEVTTRTAFPQEWAMTQNNLGVALMRIGERTTGPKRIEYLHDSIKVYETALEFRIRKDTPKEWGVTQLNLGRAYFLLQDWARSSEAYRNVLEIDADNSRLFKYWLT